LRMAGFDGQGSHVFRPGLPMGRVHRQNGSADGSFRCSGERLIKLRSS
jgi:hypothetical protein